MGFVEGLNNKIRVIQRRAYGLKDEEYFRLKVLTCMLYSGAPGGSVPRHARSCRRARGRQGRFAPMVARRRAILDRRCARRRIARAGRGGRMVPIEQKDWTKEGRTSILGQNHPLDSTKKHFKKQRNF